MALNPNYIPESVNKTSRGCSADHIFCSTQKSECSCVYHGVDVSRLENVRKFPQISWPGLPFCARCQEYSVTTWLLSKYP